MGKLKELMPVISTIQYAADLGISRQGALKRVKSKNHEGIIAVQILTREYALTTAPNYFELLGIKGHKKIVKK